MSRYMNHDSTSIPKGKSVGDIVHEMTLYAKRDPEPYVRWAGEVIELKQRIRELESLLRQAEEAITFEWGGEPYNSRPLIDRMRKALEQPR